MQQVEQAAALVGELLQRQLLIRVREDLEAADRAARALRARWV
jgi:hypothetical protein